MALRVLAKLSKYFSGNPLLRAKQLRWFFAHLGQLGAKAAQTGFKPVGVTDRALRDVAKLRGATNVAKAMRNFEHEVWVGLSKGTPVMILTSGKPNETTIDARHFKYAIDHGVDEIVHNHPPIPGLFGARHPGGPPTPSDFKRVLKDFPTAKRLTVVDQKYTYTINYKSRSVFEKSMRWHSIEKDWDTTVRGGIFNQKYATGKRVPPPAGIPKHSDAYWRDFINDRHSAGGSYYVNRIDNGRRVGNEKMDFSKIFKVGDYK